MHGMMRIGVCGAAAVIVLLVSMTAGLSSGLLHAQPRPVVLDNGLLRAEFGGNGLTELRDIASDRVMKFSSGALAVILEGREIRTEKLRAVEMKILPGSVTYLYEDGDFHIEVVYELKAGWRFVSRHAELAHSPTSPRRPFRVARVEALASRLDPAPFQELPLADGAYGRLLRYAPGPEGGSGWGAFLLLQNPFMEWRQNASGEVSVSYTPDMDWHYEYGPFVTDRLCIGLHELTGTVFPAQAVPEWKSTIDAAEVEALTDCVRSFLLHRPMSSTRVHVGWCGNDYQIDVGTPEGWDEYRRIVDRASELGLRHLLFTPHNSRHASWEENKDAWGWENLLWFSLGQKIRTGEWAPVRNDVPKDIRDMIAYMSGRGIAPLAYVYPSLAFLQDPEWTRWAGDKLGGYQGADTGVRSFQDWLIRRLVEFQRQTGASGFSFDHWWIAYDGASSRYAQWFGCRRILESLRREIPDIVIDGRQQYHNFGPWTWLAGTYPHPLMTDEQPESFTAFPDLHTDRVSANRQRYAAWRFRVESFCPPEIMPGFITHQTARHDAEGVMRRDGFRRKDWDYLGWKFSLLSSIGTAPFNHVVNVLPARDEEEHRAFSEEDKAWFRKWLDWTDANAAFLRRLRPIIGPPMIGRVDGTAAIREDRGFVFLYNPNYGRMEARFRLDASIGLARGTWFVVRELHPWEGRLIRGPSGELWEHGEEFVMEMDGTQAVVLEIFPMPEDYNEPLLFGCPGEAAVKNRILTLTEVKGEPGTEHNIRVLLPGGVTIRGLRVNGKTVPFKQDGRRVDARLRFSGPAFSRVQRVGDHDPEFAGGTFRAVLKIPARIFRQLEARKKVWPVDYTEDELRAPWLGPSRLLLYAQTAEPDDALDISITIDGQAIPVLKAYNSIDRRAPERTFLGHYADISHLEPDKDYEVEIVVPSLAPGRFLGLFLENVETEYTDNILDI
jgi:hypothetical protein